MKIQKIIFAAIFCLGFISNHSMANSSIKDPVVEKSKQMAAQNMLKITSLPVFSWLSLGQTTCQQALNSLSRFQGVRIISSGDASTITSGTFFSATRIPFQMGSYLFDEPGLRGISIHCDNSRNVSFVLMIVERGNSDENISVLIDKLKHRYKNYAIPLGINDNRGDAGDEYILFDFGRFVAEVSLPEQQDKAYITFAKRNIYERIRKEQGDWELIGPYLLNQGQSTSR